MDRHLWVPHQTLISDNDEVITGKERNQIRSMLNIRHITSNENPPWMSGAHGKNHAVMDQMVEKMTRDYPEADKSLTLRRVVNARNTLERQGGYSPRQLVFGKNQQVLATGQAEGDDHSGSVVDRRPQGKTDDSQSIGRMINIKQGCGGGNYRTGDQVFYLRGDVWRGPAAVVWQEGG